MIQYSRIALDYSRKGKPKVRLSDQKEKKVDWVNIALFILLGIVVVLFILT